ncbi:hypothetical protein [Solibacillus sp.]
MSAKRILEKYVEQRSTLPAAIDAVFKFAVMQTTKPVVIMRIEVE